MFNGNYTGFPLIFMSKNTHNYLSFEYYLFQNSQIYQKQAKFLKGYLYSSNTSRSSSKKQIKKSCISFVYIYILALKLRYLLAFPAYYVSKVLTQ